MSSGIGTRMGKCVKDTFRKKMLYRMQRIPAGVYVNRMAGAESAPRPVR
jgi:hypothetical protein